MAEFDIYKYCHVIQCSIGIPTVNEAVEVIDSSLYINIDLHLYTRQI